MADETRLNDLRAVNYILNQRISAEWIYASEEWKKEARLFCVKGLAQIDMLTEIQGKLGEAIAKGYGFQKFESEIVPYLISKGWVGSDGEELDPKAIGYRVRTIWNTNQASANASSLWQSIQETKDKFPYLQYVGSIAGEKREEHKAFYGLVAPADDQIWQRIFPPNGYGCKCSVKQLTKGQAERIIKQQEENGGRIVASDEAINKAVDSSFQHNHADLTGFNDYVVNCERTKEEKEQGKTEQEKKEENLKTAVALQREMLIEQAAKKLDLSPKKEADFRGKLETLPNTDAKLRKMTEKILEEGTAIWNDNEKYILKNKDAGKKPFDFFAPILEDVGVVGGEDLTRLFYSPEIDKTHLANIQEGIRRIPKNLISLLNASECKIFLEDVAIAGLPNWGMRAFHTFLVNEAALRLVDTKYFTRKKFVNAENGVGSSFVEIAQTGDGFLFLPFGATKETTITNSIHEPTHYLQRFFPELQALYKDYFQIRTKGDKRLYRLCDTERYKSCSIDEQYKPDDFKDEYVGKVYNNSFFEKSTHQPLEMMTVSFQSFFGEKQENFNLFLDDKDLVCFGLGLLARYGK